MIRTAQHRPTGSVPASIDWTHSGHHNEDLTRRVEPRGAGKRSSQRAERWELRGKLSSGQVGDYQRERSSVTNRGCDKSEVVDAEASNEDGRWRVLRLHQHPGRITKVSGQRRELHTWRLYAMGHDYPCVLPTQLRSPGKRPVMANAAALEGEVVTRALTWLARLAYLEPDSIELIEIARRWGLVECPKAGAVRELLTRCRAARSGDGSSGFGPRRSCARPRERSGDCRGDSERQLCFTRPVPLRMTHSPTPDETNPLPHETRRASFRVLLLGLPGLSSRGSRSGSMLGDDSTSHHGRSVASTGGVHPGFAPCR